MQALVGHRRVSGLLGLELQVVVSYPGWVLGTDLRNSTRAVGVLNH